MVEILEIASKKNNDVVTTIGSSSELFAMELLAPNHTTNGYSCDPPSIFTPVLTEENPLMF